MAHRGAALLAGAVTLALAWSLGRLGGAGRRLRNLLLVALALQLLLGVGLVTLGLPLPVAVLHNLGAALRSCSLSLRRSIAWPAAVRESVAADR